MLQGKTQVKEVLKQLEKLNVISEGERQRMYNDYLVEISKE